MFKKRQCRCHCGKSQNSAVPFQWLLQACPHLQPTCEKPHFKRNCSHSWKSCKFIFVLISSLFTEVFQLSTVLSIIKAPYISYALIEIYSYILSKAKSTLINNHFETSDSLGVQKIRKAPIQKLSKENLQVRAEPFRRISLLACSAILCTFFQ